MKYDFLLIILEVGGLRPPTSLLSQISHLKIKSQISKSPSYLKSSLLSQISQISYFGSGGAYAPHCGGAQAPLTSKKVGGRMPPHFLIFWGGKSKKVGGGKFFFRASREPSAPPLFKTLLHPWLGLYLVCDPHTTDLHRRMQRITIAQLFISSLVHQLNWCSTIISMQRRA